MCMFSARSISRHQVTCPQPPWAFSSWHIQYTGNKVETETCLKDMSHILSDAWRSTRMTCWAVSQLPMNVCERVHGREAEPQIAFNWRLKLSDSLRLSCQSRCSHHGDALQCSASLTTSGNGWLWRTVRGWVDRHTSRQNDRDTGTHINTSADRCGTHRQVHTGQKRDTLKGIRVEACWQGKLFW